VFLLPGVFGFLVWELKENRKLYRASLDGALTPARIGGHGETMTALLVPGFHSGTIPKVRVAMRRSARRIAQDEPFLALAVRSHTRARTDLHHCEEALARFVERELCVLLARTPRWRGPRLGAPVVRIGSNRISVTLASDAKGARPLVFAFEEQSGFVLAHVVDRGFAAGLDERQRGVLRDALAGLYALAAVDFVREEIERATSGAPYDVCDEGLAVWPDGAFRTELIYDLHATGEVAPIVRGDAEVPRPRLDVGSLRFPQVPWARWERTWSDPEAPPLVERPIL
jgi:hypothetical protein